MNSKEEWKPKDIGSVSDTKRALIPPPLPFLPSPPVRPLLRSPQHSKEQLGDPFAGFPWLCAVGRSRPREICPFFPQKYCTRTHKWLGGWRSGFAEMLVRGPGNVEGLMTMPVGALSPSLGLPGAGWVNHSYGLANLLPQHAKDVIMGLTFFRNGEGAKTDKSKPIRL